HLSLYSMSTTIHSTCILFRDTRQWIYRILSYPRHLLQFFLLHHLQLFVHLLSFLSIRRWPAPSLLQVLLDESADEDDFPSVNDDERIDAILAETRLLLEATYMLRAMQGTNATKKIFFHVTSAVLS
ncbi:hypothetical protein PENTCL1PPCAC_19212, partial [Pristionchus entomophagus]